MGGNRTKTKFRRQWQLVLRVQESRRGKTTSTLMEELEVSRATLYRDLGNLRDAGVPVVTERVNGEARHKLLGPALPPLAPTTLQLAALNLARAVLRPLEGSSLLEEIDTLLGRIPWGSGAGLAHVGTRADRAADTTARTAVKRLDQAIRRGRRVSFEYRGDRDASHRRRTVDPVAFRYVDQTLYLVAWDLDRDDYRTFKITRLRNVCQSPVPAESRPEFDEAALFAHAVKTWHAAPIDVTVRLAPEVTWKAHEWPLVPDQRTERAPDGSLLVHARVQGLVETTRWVLGWGQAAEALSPPELRTAVRDELTAALARYEKSARGPARVKPETPDDRRFEQG